MKKKSRWIGFARVAIIFFLFVLFINAFLFFKEVKREVLYDSRAYGLDTLNECFDNGEYQRIYRYAVSNKYADDKLSVDTSQYEAFGRYYHYYTLALSHEDREEYLAKMEAEKEDISWKKILNVIETLESELD